jgi:hypothetical protein
MALPSILRPPRAHARNRAVRDADFAFGAASGNESGAARLTSAAARPAAPYAALHAARLTVTQMFNPSEQQLGRTVQRVARPSAG